VASHFGTLLPYWRALVSSSLDLSRLFHYIVLICGSGLVDEFYRKLEKNVSELRSSEKADRQIRVFSVDINLQRFWSLRSSISIIARKFASYIGFLFSTCVC
jgi:hypothetical protein